MKTFLALCRLVRPLQVFALGYYFFARTVFLLFRLRLFRGLYLTFGDIVVFLRPDFPSGLRLIQEIYADDIYGNFLTGPDPIVLLDVGANIGLVSLKMCHERADSCAYCIEPHPGTFSLLQTNIAANQLSDRIFPFQYAASEVAGTISISVSENSNMAKTQDSPGGAIDKCIEVPSVQIDGFCSKNAVRPNVMKIDVEGHELAVLKGSQSTLDHVQKIIVECHSEDLLSACKDILRMHGFFLSTEGGLLFGQKSKKTMQPGTGQGTTSAPQEAILG